MSNSEQSDTVPEFTHVSENEVADGTPPSAGASRKRRAQTTSDSSSAESSSSEDDTNRKVKRKRGKMHNSNFDALMTQMSMISNMMMHNVYYSQWNSNVASQWPIGGQLPASAQIPLNSNVPQTSVSDCFLNRPAAAIANPPRKLELDSVNTSVKDPKVPRADPNRLKQLERLQKFGDPYWKDIRYTEALKVHCATPGFVELDVNDELRQFVKGKDYIASTERSLAAICNALLAQREYFHEHLQQFVDWAASPETVLTASSVFDKITELFNASSKYHKTDEETMQLVCGKRAECIENRRERILAELPNKTLREGLRKIPPSSEAMFDKSQLQEYIKSTGGIDKWVRPWFNLEKDKKKPVPKPTANPGPSHDTTNNTRFFPPKTFEQKVKENRAHNSGSKYRNAQKDKKPFRKEGGANKKR